jgi:hypothetical protein
MQAIGILEQVDSLIIEEKILLIERTLQSLKFELKEKQKINQAVTELMENYQTDKELTALTDLNFEDFYETR